MDDKVKNILEWVYCIIIAVILALVFRFYIGTPTIVRQKSMFPTLKEGQRLILNRTFRIGKMDMPEYGQIITFEAPSKNRFEANEIDQTTPIAKYDNEPSGLIGKFVFYVLEIGKKSYIKRTIGLPGDHIKIENGKVYRNGEELDEPYLSDDIVTTSTAFNDFIVPQGYLFAIGDNRNNSTDCRAFGCIPIEKVEGFVSFRFWPLNAFGKIDK